VEISLPLAFLAGLASFLSPCVFSLVPAYIGYLGGRAVALNPSGQSVSRWETMTHGIAFVLGFSAVFILLGIAASELGALLYNLRDWLAKIGGVVVVLFGLHMTGILRIRWLEYDLRPQSIQDQQRSYVSSALMGIFFSAGWSPCVGPTLGAILTLAARGGNVAQGIQLLTSYSAGLAIPFLLAAFGLGWVTFFLRRYQKVLHYVEIGMGVVLILVGVLLFFGIFEQLARYGWFIDFGI
jgi:cytochrome c-type biogenesis protein